LLNAPKHKDLEDILIGLGSIRHVLPLTRDQTRPLQNHWPEICDIEYRTTWLDL